MKQFLILVLPVLVLVLSCEKLEEKPIDERLCANPNSLYVLAGDTDPEKPCLIPQTERKALILYFMSNDCPGCGSWGTTLFHGILNDNPETCEGLQIHIKYSDPWIIKGFSDSLLQRYKPLFTPFVMVENRVPSGIAQVLTDTSVLLPKAKIWVDELAAEQPEIAPALEFRIEGNKLRIFYGGRFEMDTEGEYYFGLYLMEDNLEWNQAGSAVRPYYHNNTIRAAVGGAWGLELPGGTHYAGELFVGHTETDLTGYWKKEDLHMLGVIWKKDPQGKMQVVNTLHAR